MTRGLIIDTRFGIAGDIACAGLISLGADPARVVDAMETAGSLLGTVAVVPVYHGGSATIHIDLDPAEDHLAESDAILNLDRILDAISLPVPYPPLARAILAALCRAERHVHATDLRLRHMPVHHADHLSDIPGGAHLSGTPSTSGGWKAPDITRANGPVQTPRDPPGADATRTRVITDTPEEFPALDGRPAPEFPRTPHPAGQALLHEAQDILCDITGFVTGLHLLDIRSVGYIDHVTVGGGTVSFSHGTFAVPAPATRHLLESHGIRWKPSEDRHREMATPTGVSLLAGCKAIRCREPPRERIIRTGYARGSHAGFPEVPFHLVEIGDMIKYPDR